MPKSKPGKRSQGGGGKGRSEDKKTNKGTDRDANHGTDHDKGMSTGMRIAGMFINPVRTLEDVIRRPAALRAVVFFIGVNLLFTLAILDKIQEHAVWRVEYDPPPGLSPEELIILAEQAPAMASLYSITGAVISPLITWLLVCLVLRLVGSGGGRMVSFPLLFTVAVFAMTPHMLGLYLESVARFFIDPHRLDFLYFSISAATLLPGSEYTPAFPLLNAIKPFTIWALVLASIGGAKVLGFKFARVGVPLIGLWLLLALVQTITYTGP